MVDTDSNWIKLHRNLITNELWRSEPFSKGQAWVDMLLLANHSDGFFFNRGIRVDVKRGQVGMSELQLSIRWKWSRTKVKNFFSLLEKEQQIVQHRNNVNSLITIVNYDTYQDKTQQKVQQESNRSTAEVQQENTNKNEKNEKKEKKEKKEKNKTEEYFFPPATEDVQGYMDEIGFCGDGERFVSYYESKGWKVGRTPMKDWKAAVRHWKTNQLNRQHEKPSGRVNSILSGPTAADITQMELAVAGCK